MKAELKKQGVEFSPVHHEAMNKLQEKQGSSQKMLAQAMERNKAQIARIVANLLHQELIYKETDAADKRSVKLTISPKGQKLLKRLNEVQSEIFKEMLSGFSSEEIDTFNSFLKRANQGLK
ncbi:MAG: MarR family transcriptional regulator [Desulfuromusa sp.]|nr:MarR family transcriptional regulator [Desulfuromusa sp.]